MAISTFLNPPEEVIQDTSKDLTEQIAQEYDPPELDSSEDKEILPKVSPIEAIKALQQLRLHEMQQLDGDYHLIELLDEKEAILHQRKAAGTHQSRITAFFE